MDYIALVSTIRKEFFNMNFVPFSDIEIEMYVGEPIGEAINRVLNNLFLHLKKDRLLPDGTIAYDESNYRHYAKRFYWNTPYGTYFCDCHEDCSIKRLQQTGEEFYWELDRTIEELHMSVADVYETVGRWKAEGQGDASIEIQLLLWKTLLPIYIAMRKKSYSKHDLIG